MKKIIIWRGHHGSEILDLVQKTISSPDNLLILCPPRMNDLESYLPFLPTGKIEFRGELADRDGLINQSQVDFPESPKFGLFSSGTTDVKPKLILYTKENLESACEGIFSFFNGLEIKSVYSYPQPYHIFGLSLGYIASLKFGWELLVADGNYSRAHHELWIESVKIKGDSLLTLGTPTHFLDVDAFVRHYNLALTPSLASIAGGAKVEQSLWDKMNKDLMINYPSVGYGCSEASPGVTHLTPGLRPGSDGHLGFVLPNGKLLEGAEGFTYEGPNVCLAIIQNDEIFFPRGSYLLSDTLEQDADGHYHFKKRSDLVLNRGGEKFSLEEIESAVKSRFNIDSVAVGIEDERLGFELALLFEGPKDLGADIHKSLNELFKRNFKLNYFLDISKLPINANAKFDRKVSKDMILERL